MAAAKGAKMMLRPLLAAISMLEREKQAMKKGIGFCTGFGVIAMSLMV